MTRRHLMWRHLILVLKRIRLERRWFILVPCWLGLSFWLFHEVGATAEFGAGRILKLLGLALVITFAIGVVARWRVQTGKSLRESFAKPSPADPDLGSHRARIAEELLRVAALVDRAGTEWMLQQDMDVGLEHGSGRRRTLDAAQSPGVWEGLEEHERALLTGQEGCWPEGETWHMLMRSEDVRVLRWVVGIDEVLTPFEFLRQELMIAVDLTAAPGKVEGKKCLPPWDLRPAQTVAQTMVARCAGEGMRRGIYEGLDDDLVFFAERLDASPTEDLLIASGTTIGNASDEELQRVSQAALRRLKALNRIVDFLHEEGTEQFRVEQPTL